MKTLRGIIWGAFSAGVLLASISGCLDKRARTGEEGRLRDAEVQQEYDVPPQQDVSTSDAFDVPSVPGNDLPILRGIGSRHVQENQSLTLDITAEDADGDTLTYSTSDLPEGAGFNNGRFSWMPACDQSGEYRVTFRVTDGRGGSDEETISITVEEACGADCRDGAVQRRECTIPESPCIGSLEERCTRGRWEAQPCSYGLEKINDEPSHDAQIWEDLMVYLVPQGDKVKLMLRNVLDGTTLQVREYDTFGNNCLISLKQFANDKVFLQTDCESPGNPQNRILDAFNLQEYRIIDVACELNDQLDVNGYLVCQGLVDLTLATIDAQNNNQRRKIFSNQCRYEPSPAVWARHSYFYDVLAFETNNMVDQPSANSECPAQESGASRIVVYHTNPRGTFFPIPQEPGTYDFDPRISSRGAGQGLVFFRRGRLDSPEQRWMSFDIISRQVGDITPGTTRREGMSYSAEELAYAGNVIAFLDLLHDQVPQQQESRLVLYNLSTNGSAETSLPVPHLRRMDLYSDVVRSSLVLETSSDPREVGDIYLCRLKDMWR